MGSKGMVKAKSRLLTHHAQPSQPPQRKFVTLSNTSKRIRKVFTASASGSSSPLVEQRNQPEQELLDSSQPIIMDNLDSAPTNVDYPANIFVCTKAKRYQNSVHQCHHRNSASCDPPPKDAPLLTWKRYQDEYLDACLMLDGRG